LIRDLDGLFNRDLEVYFDGDLDGILDGDFLGVFDGDLDGDLLGQFDGLFEVLSEGDLACWDSLTVIWTKTGRRFGWTLRRALGRRF
jgi:hypothetical protein